MLHTGHLANVLPAIEVGLLLNSLTTQLKQEGDATDTLVEFTETWYRCLTVMKLSMKLSPSQYTDILIALSLFALCLHSYVCPRFDLV